VDAIYMQAVQMLTQHGGWPMSVFLTPEASRSSPARTFPPATGSAARASASAASSRSWIGSGGRSGRGPRSRRNRSRRPCSRASPRTPQRGCRSCTSCTARCATTPRCSTRARARVPRAEVPLQHERPLPAAVLEAHRRRAGAADGAAHAGEDGARRHLRSGGRRVPPLLHRRALAGPSLREDALRQLPCSPSPTSKAGRRRRARSFRRIAVETLDAVGREMTDPSGAFWSATDADSEGEEGTFFVWTPAQLREVLGEEDGARAARLFRATDEGNFEGSNVLSFGSVPDEGELAFLESIRPKLYQARKEAPSSADRHQDPHLVERADDLRLCAGRSGVCARGLRAARCEGSRRAVYARTFRTGSCGAPAATPACSRTTPSSARRWSICTKRPARGGGWTTARALHESARASVRAPGRRLLPHAGRSRGAAGAREAGLRRRGAHRELGRGLDPAPPGGAHGRVSLRDQADKLLRSFGALLGGAPAALGEMLLALELLPGGTARGRAGAPGGKTDGELLDPVRTRFEPWQVLVRHQQGSPSATPLATIARPRKASRPPTSA